MTQENSTCMKKKIYHDKDVRLNVPKVYELKNSNPYEEKFITNVS